MLIMTCSYCSRLTDLISTSPVSTRKSLEAGRGPRLFELCRDKLLGIGNQNTGSRLVRLYSACKRRAVGLLAAASWGLNTPNPSLQSPVSACVMLKMHTTTSRTRVRFFDSVSRGRPRTFQQSRRGQICKYRTPVHGTRPKDTMYNAPVTATLTCSDWSPDGGGDRWVVVL